MSTLSRFLALCVVLLVLCGAAVSAECHVGPGQQYEQITDLAAAVTLVDNDTVWVHPDTYAPFRFQTGGGNSPETAPVICAWNPLNKLLIDAAGATNGIWFEDMSGSLALVDKWFALDGFEVINAASRGVYYVSSGLVMRNCYIHHCEDGLMDGWHNCRYDERGFLIAEHNEFAYSGGGVFDHQAYVQSYCTEWRYNYMHDETGGNVYKDRSVESLLEYNYIVAGDNALCTIDFCGFDDRTVGDIGQYATMTGNVLLKRNGQGTYTICVDNLTKTGYPYQSCDHHETCDSIMLP